MVVYGFKYGKTLIKGIILSLGTISVMCTGAIAPALPIIANNFSNVPDAKFWVRLIVTVPHLVIAVTAPFAGWFTTRLDRRLMLVFAIFAYSTLGASCGFISSIYAIIAMRALVGFCIAIVLSVSSTLIADLFDGKERSEIIGLQTTFMSIGTVTYGILGGIIADVNWRGNFLLYLLPMAVIPFIYFFLIDPYPKRGKKHKAVFNKEVEPNDKVYSQSNPTIVVVYLLSILTMAMYYMIPLQLPFLLYAMEGMTAKKISYVLVTETISAATCAFLYKYFKEKLECHTLSALSFVAMSLSYFIISTQNNYFVIMFTMVIFGFGMGVNMPNMTLWIINVTKPLNRGLVIGGMFSAIYSGKFLSSILITQMGKVATPHTTYFMAACLMATVALAIAAFSGKKKLH